jgi:hypothetical protein
VISELDTAWQWLIEALGSAALFILGLLGRLAIRWLGIKISEAKQRRLEQIADAALAWAVNRGMSVIRTKQWDHPETLLHVLREAADYAAVKYGGTLRRLGVRIGHPKSDKTLGELFGILERRYPSVLAQELAAYEALQRSPIARSSPLLQQPGASP